MIKSGRERLGPSKLILCFPLHRKLEGMRVGGSLFITRGSEQNERSSSATEMNVQGSTVDLLDSEHTQTVPTICDTAAWSFFCSRDLSERYKYSIENG